MKIKSPCMITPRLCAGIEIGDAWVSIEYSDRAGDNGRIRYRWFIDFKDGREFSGEDLPSGAWKHAGLQYGLENLLVFLGAFAEAQRYPDSDNRDLFDAGLAEWATQNSDEILILACGLEENPGKFIDE